jgi:hypothetical protein
MPCSVSERRPTSRISSSSTARAMPSMAAAACTACTTAES